MVTLEQIKAKKFETQELIGSYVRGQLQKLCTKYDLKYTSDEIHWDCKTVYNSSFGESCSTLFEISVRGEIIEYFKQHKPTNIEDRTRVVEAALALYELIAELDDITESAEATYNYLKSAGNYSKQNS